MEGASGLGRVVFAAAMVGFGLMYLLHVMLRTPAVGPPWPVGAGSLEMMAGALFLIFGAALLSRATAGVGAPGLGIVLLVYAAVTYGPQLVRHPTNPSPWTAGFEVLAMAGAAFALAADGGGLGLGRLGEWLFGVALVVFGCQHLIYAQFVAHLIPGWIPQRLLWAYFTGGAMIAAGLAIGLRRINAAAGMLVGLMFFLFVVLVHVPYVAHAMRDGAQWTSAMVAVAMCGAGLILGGTRGGPVGGGFGTRGGGRRRA